MKKILIIVLLNIFTVVLFADSYIDSLKISLESSKGLKRNQILLQIANSYQQQYDPISIKYAKQAVTIAEKCCKDSVIGISYKKLADLLLTLESPRNSIQYYKKSISIFEIANNEDLLAKLYNNISIAFQRSDLPEESFEYSSKVLEIRKRTGTPLQIAKAKLTVGNSLISIQQPEEAIKIYSDVLDYFKKDRNYQIYVKTLTNLATCENMLSNYEVAINYLEKAHTVAVEQGMNNVLQSISYNLALSYSELKKYDKALKMYFEVLKIREKSGKVKDIAGALNGIGRAFQGKKEYNESLKYIKKSLDLSLKNNLDNLIVINYRMLGEIYKNLGENSLSSDYLLKYADSLPVYLEKVYTDRIGELQNNLKNQQTEAENKILKKESLINDLILWKQKILIYFFIISSFLLLISIIFINKRYHDKKRDGEILKKEKDKSEILLNNILPVKVVEDLQNRDLAKPILYSDFYEDVTILFTDFVNFTDFCTHLSPSNLISELNKIFTAFDEIIEKNHCERIKTIGDSYLAVCGMPEKNKDHVKNILTASKEILSYLKNRNMNLSDKSLSLDIRIGVHSGNVIGGIVGIRKFIYDVFGDSINTASRMETYSKSMKINVSENTYNLSKALFSFEERQEINVKGKGKMKMYFLEN